MLTTEERLSTGAITKDFYLVQSQGSKATNTDICTSKILLKFLYANMKRTWKAKATKSTSWDFCFSGVTDKNADFGRSLRQLHNQIQWKKAMMLPPFSYFQSVQEIPLLSSYKINEPFQHRAKLGSLRLHPQCHPDRNSSVSQGVSLALFWQATKPQAR